MHGKEYLPFTTTFTVQVSSKLTQNLALNSGIYRWIPTANIGAVWYPNPWMLKLKQTCKYDQIWSNMIKYDQIWSNMIKYDQIWSNMIKYDQIWPHSKYDLWVVYLLCAPGRVHRTISEGSGRETPRHGHHHPHLQLPNEERSVAPFTIAIENGHLLLIYRFTY